MKEKILLWDFDGTITNVHTVKFSDVEKEKAVQNPASILKTQAITTFSILINKGYRIGIITQHYDGEFIKKLLMSGFNQSISIANLSESFNFLNTEWLKSDIFILHRKDRVTTAKEASKAADWKVSQIKNLLEFLNHPESYYWDDNVENIRALKEKEIPNLVTEHYPSHPGDQRHFFRARCIGFPNKQPIDNLFEYYKNSTKSLEIIESSQTKKVINTSSNICIPSSLLIQILSFLSIDEIFHCLRINKQWNSIIISSNLPSNIFNLLGERKNEFLQEYASIYKRFNVPSYRRFQRLLNFLENIQQQDYQKPSDFFRLLIVGLYDDLENFNLLGTKKDKNNKLIYDMMLQLGAEKIFSAICDAGKLFFTIANEEVFLHPKIVDLLKYGHSFLLQSIVEILNTHNQRNPEFFTSLILGNTVDDSISFRFLYQSGQLAVNEKLLFKIAKSGNCSALQEILPHFSNIKIVEPHKLFTSAVNSGNSQIVKYVDSWKSEFYRAIHFHPDILIKMMQKTFENEHIGLTHYLLERYKNIHGFDGNNEKGVNWDKSFEDLFNHILEAGNLHLLQFLTATCQLIFNAQHLKILIKYNQLKMIQYLIEEGGTRADYSHLIEAAEEKEWNIFNYLAKNVFCDELFVLSEEQESHLGERTPLGFYRNFSNEIANAKQKILTLLIKEDQLEILQYLITRGVTPEKLRIQEALSFGHWEIAKCLIVSFLSDQNPPETSFFRNKKIYGRELLIKVIQDKQLGILKYLMGQEAMPGDDNLLELAKEESIKQYLTEEKMRGNWQEYVPPPAPQPTILMSNYRYGFIPGMQVRRIRIPVNVCLSNNNTGFFVGVNPLPSNRNINLNLN